jgi:hypothetical protein
MVVVNQKVFPLVQATFLKSLGVLISTPEIWGRRRHTQPESIYFRALCFQTSWCNCLGSQLLGILLFDKFNEFKEAFLCLDVPIHRRTPR